MRLRRLKPAALEFESAYAHLDTQQILDFPWLSRSLKPCRPLSVVGPERQMLTRFNAADCNRRTVPLTQGHAKII